jgi:anti-sigma factor RsiW
MSLDRERVVAGISCGEVLDGLSAYVDGELPAERRERVEEHLRGCDVCARFGGEFKATIRALRAHLLRPAPLPPAVQTWLRAALADERRG